MIKHGIPENKPGKGNFIVKHKEIIGLVFFLFIAFGGILRITCVYFKIPVVLHKNKGSVDKAINFKDTYWDVKILYLKDESKVSMLVGEQNFDLYVDKSCEANYLLKNGYYKSQHYIWFLYISIQGYLPLPEIGECLVDKKVFLKNILKALAITHKSDCVFNAYNVNEITLKCKNHGVYNKMEYVLYVFKKSEKD